MLGRTRSEPLSRVVLTATAVTVLAATACNAAERVTEAITASASTTPSVPGGPSPTVDPAIVVERPLANDEVGSPVSIAGTAQVTGDAVLIRVLGADGGELAATIADVACDRDCRFATELFFFVEDRQAGSVAVSASEVPQSSATMIPVVLVPS